MPIDFPPSPSIGDIFAGYKWSGTGWTIAAIPAPIDSPAFTGNPTAPTPATADNDTSIATTAFVQANMALKQNALGFTPVQQSGGIGQTAGALKFGYSSGGYPKLTIDVTDFGRIWAELNQGASLTGNGYFKLPNGWLLQWGASGGDAAVTFPTAFPNWAASIVLTPFIGSVPAASNMWSCMVASKSNTGFSGFLRFTNGSTPIVGGESWYWFAIGW